MGATDGKPEKATSMPEKATSDRGNATFPRFRPLEAGLGTLATSTLLKLLKGLGADAVKCFECL